MQRKEGQQDRAKREGNSVRARREVVGEIPLPRAEAPPRGSSATHARGFFHIIHGMNSSNKSHYFHIVLGHQKMDPW